MKIIFIRHAEGYHNLYTKQENNWHIKFPRLTVVGLKQCKDLQKKMENKVIDYIYVSPLRRTLETALHVFPSTNATMEADDSIREFVVNPCDYCEDITKEYMEEFSKVDFTSIINKQYRENGESQEQIEERMDSFYEKLLLFDTEKTKTVVVITHGEFLRRFFKRFQHKLQFVDEEGDKETFMENCEYRTVLME